MQININDSLVLVLTEVKLTASVGIGVNVAAIAEFAPDKLQEVSSAIRDAVTVSIRDSSGTENEVTQLFITNAAILQSPNGEWHLKMELAGIEWFIGQLKCSEVYTETTPLEVVKLLLEQTPIRFAEIPESNLQKDYSIIRQNEDAMSFINTMLSFEGHFCYQNRNEFIVTSIPEEAHLGKIFGHRAIVHINLATIFQPHNLIQSIISTNEGQKLGEDNETAVSEQISNSSELESEFCAIPQKDILQGASEEIASSYAAGLAQATSCNRERISFRCHRLVFIGDVVEIEDGAVEAGRYFVSDVELQFKSGQLITSVNAVALESASFVKMLSLSPSPACTAVVCDYEEQEQDKVQAGFIKVHMPWQSNERAFYARLKQKQAGESLQSWRMPAPGQELSLSFLGNLPFAPILDGGFFGERNSLLNDRPLTKELLFKDELLELSIERNDDSQRTISLVTENSHISMTDSSEPILKIEMNAGSMEVNIKKLIVTGETEFNGAVSVKGDATVSKTLTVG